MRVPTEYADHPTEIISQGLRLEDVGAMADATVNVDRDLEQFPEGHRGHRGHRG